MFYITDIKSNRDQILCKKTTISGKYLLKIKFVENACKDACYYY